MCFKTLCLFPCHVYCTFISDKKLNNSHGVARLQIYGIMIMEDSKPQYSAIYLPGNLVYF